MKKSRSYKGMFIFWCIGVVSTILLFNLGIDGLGGLVVKGLGLYMIYFMFKVSVGYGLSVLSSKKYKSCKEFSKRDSTNDVNKVSRVNNKINNERYLKDVKPVYLETVDLFKYGIQNKCLSREDILRIKDEINNIITNNYNAFKPKNDAHEIYTKLKDKGISKEQMEQLRDFIRSRVMSLT